MANELARGAETFLSGKIRWVLLAGFGGLLLLMTAAGIGAIRVVKEIQTGNERIRNEFLNRNRILNGIRSQLYLSGTYVRDYLLDPSPPAAERNRASLDETRRTMEVAVQAYGKQASAREAGPFSQMQSELADYWRILNPVWNWTAQQRRDRGYPFLHDELFPRRKAMLAMADQIADINEQQLRLGNAELTALFHQFETRLYVALMLTFSLGLGMAIFSSRRILVLEAEADARYREILRARAELKDLSSRLVRAQEDERRAIARELHDEVGQSLSAVLVELRNLSEGIGTPSNTKLRGHVEVIKGLVESSVRVARNMSLLLRPSMLDDLGLAPALQWQAREMSRRTNMDVTVSANLASDDLPDDLKTCIYRIVQEALNNSARHSGARCVQIRVQQDAERIRLSIQDDGRGFDPGTTKGMGLLGIQERVAGMGGHWSMESRPGMGALLTVELTI